MTSNTYLRDVKNIYTTSYSVSVLKNDGTVWSWGYNNVGQLGNGTNTDNSYPVQMKIDASTVVEDVERLGTTENTVYVLTKEGKLYATGLGTSRTNRKFS